MMLGWALNLGFAASGAATQVFEVDGKVRARVGLVRMATDGHDRRATVGRVRIARKP